MLHSLKLAELTSELHPLASVCDGKAARGIEHTDDLVAARPRAAARQLVGNADIGGAEFADRHIECERPARFASQVVAVDDLRIADQTDMQRIGRPRRQHDGA